MKALSSTRRSIAWNHSDCYLIYSCVRTSRKRFRHFSYKFLVLLATLAITALLAGCVVGPRYEEPASAVSANWKELPAAEGWRAAQPSDALDRGAWWQRFDDPVLDSLAARVQVDNQNIAAAVANYAQANALVRGQRAALWPQLSAGAGAQRGKNAARPLSNSVSADLNASWTPDVWGRLRSAVSGAEANAQGSAADLAAARLSAIGAVASNYFSLREADAEIALLDETIVGFERAFTITKNRYAAGIAAQTDVLQAQTQLVNTRAARAALARSRATFEHAIAVGVGAPPGDFNLPVEAWKPSVPTVPIGVPSTLLERRPDIASAERTVAAANAQIGVARAAYFPNLGLSGSYGSSASRVGDLFSAPYTLWSLGLSVAQVIFDGGAIGADVDAARAARDASVARYRQTVLSAFQAVEDQLVASASLAQQASFNREASVAADKTEQQLLNRYRAGQVNYTDVVTAQAAALSARRTLVQVQLARQLAAVALIQALGGGWESDAGRHADLPGSVP